MPAAASAMFEPQTGIDDLSSIAVRGLNKRYVGTQALADVDLDVLPGEIHALLGGNGSGKSTLIKILAGVLPGEPGGTVRVGSHVLDSDAITPATSHALGVRVVHQDLGIFAGMSVAENVSLGRGYEHDAAGRVKWRQVRRRTEKLIDRFEIPAKPSTLLQDMSLGAQAQVAIARALQDVDIEHRGLLILDEPTAALPTHEADQLLRALRRYADQGHSILYVTHRLGEVVALCNRATVLRDGVRHGTFDVAQLDEDALAELIVGHAIAERVDEPGAIEPTANTASMLPRLEVCGLSAGPLDGVELTVGPGEIVGLAGLLGSGRSEILRAVFGALPIRRGSVAINGQPVRFRGPSDAVAAGVAYVPENRSADAAFLDLSVHTNLSMVVLRKYWRGLRLRHRESRTDSNRAIERFGVKAPSSAPPLATLSGGNQQKVIMGRWLQASPQLLLLDEPTQGVDIAARHDIHVLVRQAVAGGAAALVVASDFEELAELADRVLVVSGGRIVEQIRGPELTALRLTQATR